MDIRNADSRELFADIGGFKLGQDTTVDGDKVVAARQAKEEAKAVQDASQRDFQYKNSKEDQTLRTAPLSSTKKTTVAQSLRADTNFSILYHLAINSTRLMEIDEKSLKSPNLTELQS